MMSHGPLSPNGRSGKSCAPFIKLHQALCSELLEAMASLFCCLFTFGMSFGKEFVCPTNKLFFEGDRHEVAWGKGQALVENLLTGKSCTCMPFANTGIGFEVEMTQLTFVAQQFGAKVPVEDVGLGSKTLDAWGVAAADADVVKQGCIVNELGINPSQGMATDGLQGFLGYQTAVGKQYVAQGCAVGVVGVDDIKRQIHLK